VDGSAHRRPRTRATLPQAAVAARLGVTANSVARWERDEVPISEAMARLIRLTLAIPPRRRKGD
jgi:transcriptional regulator with XRE-family HTH domain